MKVLLVNATFGGVSGSGRHAYLLWKHLKHLVDFDLLSLRTVGYVDIPKLRSPSFYLLAKLRRKSADILHIHNPKFAGLIERDTPSIVTIHGDHRFELTLKYGRIVRPIIAYIDRCLERADVITCVSPYWAKERNWYWIPNMIDLSEVQKIRPAGDSYLLFVGRDDPIKDYPFFHRIALNVWRELGVKSLSLGVVRRNTEYLKHDRVSWRRVIAYMKSAVALVITSKQEGMPTTMLEAWGSKCPIIARDIPPLEWFSKTYGTPLLFRTVDEAVDLVEKCMRKTFREQQAKIGLETVSQFDAPKVANQYYKLYEKVVS